MATMGFEDVVNAIRELKQQVIAQSAQLTRIQATVSSLDGKARSNNPKRLLTGRMTLSTAAVAVNLPHFPIPNGFKVVLKATFGNSGDIWVGGDALDSADSSRSFLLDANEAVDLYMYDLSEIWVTATSADDSIQWIVEVDTDY